MFISQCRNLAVMWLKNVSSIYKRLVQGSSMNCSRFLTLTTCCRTLMLTMSFDLLLKLQRQGVRSISNKTHSLFISYHFHLCSKVYSLCQGTGALHDYLIRAVRPHTMLRTSPYCKKIFSHNLLKK